MRAATCTFRRWLCQGNRKALRRNSSRGRNPAASTAASPPAGRPAEAASGCAPRSAAAGNDETTLRLAGALASSSQPHRTALDRSAPPAARAQPGPRGQHTQRGTPPPPSPRRHQPPLVLCTVTQTLAAQNASKHPALPVAPQTRHTQRGCRSRTTFKTQGTGAFTVSSLTDAKRRRIALEPNNIPHQRTPPPTTDSTLRPTPRVIRRTALAYPIRVPARPAARVHE